MEKVYLNPYGQLLEEHKETGGTLILPDTDGASLEVREYETMLEVYQNFSDKPFDNEMYYIQSEREQIQRLTRFLIGWLITNDVPRNY